MAALPAALATRGADGVNWACETDDIMITDQYKGITIPHQYNGIGLLAAPSARIRDVPF